MFSKIIINIKICNKNLIICSLLNLYHIDEPLKKIVFNPTDFIIILINKKLTLQIVLFIFLCLADVQKVRKISVLNE